PAPRRPRPRQRGPIRTRPHPARSRRPLDQFAAELRRTLVARHRDRMCSWLLLRYSGAEDLECADRAVRLAGFRDLTALLKLTLMQRFYKTNGRVYLEY